MGMSDQEKETFAALEQELRSDPKFAASTRVSAGNPRVPLLGVAMVLAGFATLFFGISVESTPWLVVLSVLGFSVAIFGGVLLYNGRHPSQSSIVGREYVSAGSRSKSGFMQNLEDRWDDRRNNQI